MLETAQKSKGYLCPKKTLTLTLDSARVFNSFFKELKNQKRCRVKYVGMMHSSGLPFPVQRGPRYSFRGKIEGNDLCGLCEEDHGFFCTADLLRLDCFVLDDSERIAITELIEVVTEEAKEKKKAKDN
ncbi:hypothetical protein IEQ34_010908 [Dendrobium chrysotoxum]|uniref:Uncharacterized protein n=1 Tax=Dendrobium chrysotoxum TaxID=161865 RepID=A0AAV7GEP9_DENCH|nr:hypothetical protein IEQ34_010908 [Dendrobium chrysotoxum]